MDLSDSKKTLEFLTDYIDKNFIDINSYEVANQKVIELSELLNKYDFDISIELIEELITKNEKFNTAIEFIYEELYIQISNNDFSNINNDILIKILKKYIDLKSLDIDNISEEYSYSSDDNYEDGFAKYLKDINNYPLLTAEEEVELAYKIKNGDQNAKNKFINSNLRLVISIAKKFHSSTLSILDLVQEGNMGLMQAVNKFDVTLGYKFSTYATWWIKQYISRAIIEKGSSIRISTHMYGKILKEKVAHSKLYLLLNREPTIDEIAKELNMTVKEVIEIYKYDYDMKSTNMLVNEDEDSELGDFIASDEDLEEYIVKSSLKSEIMKLINSSNLNDREIKIILLRNGFIGNRVYTLKQVAQMYNLTRERVRQIEKRAIGKLRKSSNLSNILEYSQNIGDNTKIIKSVKQSKNVMQEKEINSINKSIVVDNDISYFEQLKKELFKLYEKYNSDQISFMLSNLDNYEIELLNNINSENNCIEEQITYFNKYLFFKVKFLLINSNDYELNMRHSSFLNMMTKFRNEIEGYYISDTQEELSIEDCDKIFELLDSEKLLKFIDVFPFRDVICSILNGGYINNKKLSIDYIGELLKVPKSTIINSINRILKFYRGNYESFFEIINNDEDYKIKRL